MLIKINRREFLRGSACAGALAALKSVFNPSVLMAQSVQNAAGKNIIFINLRGGSDGLAMCPYYEGPIADLVRTKLRPTIHIPTAQVVKYLNQGGEPDKIGLHPTLAPLLAASDNSIKIIQQYGNTYDDERSHETAQILLSLGQVKTKKGGNTQGILAKLSDVLDWKSFQYWGLGGSNTPEFRTLKIRPTVVDGLDSYNISTSWSENQNDRDFFVEIQQIFLDEYQPKTNTDGLLKTGYKGMFNSVDVVGKEVRPQVVGNNTYGHYTNTSFGRQIRDTAKILKAKETSSSFGQKERATLIHLDMNGYDTHSNQNANNSSSLNARLDEFSKNLAVLVQDLKTIGTWNRTVIVILSEFGRTHYENGTPGQTSVGTDHAWANNTIVLGGPVKAGLVGNFPQLTELNNSRFNALTPSIDFRDIYSDLFEWVGVDPASVFEQPDYSRKNLGLFV
jgi:uncharacterized protein (DUF1501 family)